MIKKIKTEQCSMPLFCSFRVLLSRLAGANKEESVRTILFIGVIMMQRNNIRRMTPIRRTIDNNVARIWKKLIVLIVQFLHYLPKDTVNLLLSKLWNLDERKILDACFDSPERFLRSLSLSCPRGLRMVTS